MSFNSSRRKQEEKKKEQPKPCLECGGDLKWDRQKKVYVCTSCGLEITEEERRGMKYRKEEKTDEVKEYLQWWLSSKKK